MRTYAICCFLLICSGCGMQTKFEKMMGYDKWETGSSSDSTPAVRAEPRPREQPQPRPEPQPASIKPLTPALSGGDPPLRPQEVQKVIQAMDPVVFVRPQVYLSILQFTVPVGTIGGNEKFWKRVDEAAIDARTHDILDRNGIRAGLVPMSELDALMAQTAKLAPEAKPTVYAASGTKNIELPMKQAVPYQIVYHFGPDGEMPVRSYDDSDNLLCLEFQAAPRKPGDIRVGICPTIRSRRTQLVAVNNLNVVQVERITPEYFFDLNLLTDIPLDSFLVIAPSAEARSGMSIGSTFLVSGGDGGQKETVILLIPQAVQSKDKRNAESRPVSRPK
ncbi:MAG: hypothetical protein ABSH20_25985 [Tepidisphaeraceae bacterium]|jgi:hypothetical protein